MRRENIFSCLRFLYQKKHLCTQNFDIWGVAGKPSGSWALGCVHIFTSIIQLPMYRVYIGHVFSKAFGLGALLLCLWGEGGFFFAEGLGGNCRLTLCTIFCACHRQLCTLAGCFKLRSSVHFTCICRKSALALIDIISSFEDSDPSDTSMRL